LFVVRCSKWAHSSEKVFTERDLYAETLVGQPGKRRRSDGQKAGGHLIEVPTRNLVATGFPQKGRRSSFPEHRCARLLETLPTEPLSSHVPASSSQEEKERAFVCGLGSQTGIDYHSH